ncbi:ABC transporter permease [Marispirochaeta aestuarii]|uniref:ABC transporter permease n=1 Tax=Marispirochaeta aestuarii TaxID=1963862 RepID=UPI0029C94061|nr:ABC transporter permease [Marispirochaeta aestuarii]
MFSAPLMIARRLVFRRERRISSHLKGTVLGISLSLIPLILVMIVSSGMIKGITARFLELGTFHLQARSYNQDVPWQDIGNQLAEEHGIKAAFPVIQGLGMLYSPRGRVGVTLKGFTPDMWEKDQGFRDFMIVEAGEFDLSDPEGIVVTSGVAESLGVEVGDRVKLLTSRTSSSGALFLRPSFFTLKGICSTGYYELDALTAYIPYTRADSILRGQGTHYIGMKIEEPFSGIREIKGRLARDLGMDWYILDWQELQRPMYSSFETSRNLILLIMALIVLVATLNISATLGMLVLENQEQIAILKATGSSGFQVGLVFIIAGLLTGLAGVLPGLAFGLLLAVNINGIIFALESTLNFTVLIISRLSPLSGAPVSLDLFDSSYYLETIPVELDPVSLWLAVLFTLAVSCAAAIIPALRAASVQPMEILRRR